MTTTINVRPEDIGGATSQPGNTPAARAIRRELRIPAGIEVLIFRRYVQIGEEHERNALPPEVRLKELEFQTVPHLAEPYRFQFDPMAPYQEPTPVREAPIALEAIVKATRPHPRRQRDDGNLPLL